MNLIKVKRDGTIKGRSCANGQKQRKYVSEEDNFSSPTVSNEALMNSLTIDSFEGRDVAITDVPGAYLHAKMPEGKCVVMRLVGVFVDIMCQVNPEYVKYVYMKTIRKYCIFVSTEPCTVVSRALSCGIICM